MIITKRLKDLSRKQLVKLLTVNPKCTGRVTPHDLRLWLMLKSKDEFTNITFDNRTWKLK